MSAHWASNPTESSSHLLCDSPNQHYGRRCYVVELTTMVTAGPLAVLAVEPIAVPATVPVVELEAVHVAPSDWLSAGESMN